MLIIFTSFGFAICVRDNASYLRGRSAGVLELKKFQHRTSNIEWKRMKKERIFRDRLIIDHYVRQECLTYLKRKKKSPLTSLAGSGRACFYACFFTLCQAGMPNVLEESPNEVTDYYHTGRNEHRTSNIERPTSNIE